MTSTPRHAAILAIAAGHTNQRPEAPEHHGRRIGARLPEHFGSKVFNDAVQRRRLPQSVYQAVRRLLEKGEPLSNDAADAVASAMKDWAVEHGATHYTHWFQPLHGLTAEKHDAFLSPTLEGGAIQEFSGEQLIMGEPDASSLPSGGVRNTFEARGYTGWDPSSPAFLRETEHGATLTIPTVFASWTGEALDMKTPLLRSCEALDRQARRVLSLIDQNAGGRVTATVGPEQEYFLIDRRLYPLRPDLVASDRTLIGARPAKGQELEDHYFSLTPRRILDFMMDLEAELWALGVPVKTRHGEVAPHQFELAPVFESAALAADHNMLTMEVLQDVATRHGFKALLHEKPFAGVNGSGKHVNWSMSTEGGENLLSPGDNAAENLRFLVFLAAVVRAVDINQDLLRCSIATAGNDHRLGANEAPPAIISSFLGDELQAVVDTLIDGSSGQRGPRGGTLDMGVGLLPNLPIDTSDRNRTSPFAFTGAKFEFRAVGSSQSIALPVTVINTAVADALDHLAGLLEQRGATQENVLDLVRETLRAHRRILFGGDNYSTAWADEAAARGLSNLRDTPTALATFARDAHRELFERHGVLTPSEFDARGKVMNQAYVHRLQVEATALLDLGRTSVLPAAMRFQERLAVSIQALEAVQGSVAAGQRKLLSQIASHAEGLIESLGTLEAELDSEGLHADDPGAAARLVRDRVVPAMGAVREHADALEALVDDDLWSVPKYRELLFLH
jgi:glutamine synthetase